MKTNADARYYHPRQHAGSESAKAFVADVYSADRDLGFLWENGGCQFVDLSAVGTAARAQGLQLLPDDLRKKLLHH